MNVVENEAPFAEGYQGLPEERSPHARVSKTARVPAPSKTALTPLQRGVPHLPSGAVKRSIAESSRGLRDFVAPLEEQIRKAARYRTRSQRGARGAASKVARLVLSTIRQLAHRETGMFALDPNISLLLSTLYAGSVEASIVNGLVRRAEAMVSINENDESDYRSPQSSTRDLNDDFGSHGYDIGRELDELTMLLKWYVRRKISLAGIEIGDLRGLDAEAENGGAYSDEDALFGFEVLHDNQVFGVKGCFVACGLRLVGHDSQPLWLRVSVRWNGAAVAVRPEWSSWTDPGGAGSVEIVSESAPFCSLVPIRPQAQRLVIDDVRAFVPYAALDLPAGRCDVDLVVSVIDNEGRELLSAFRQESICVPRRELASSNVPAPHAVGMWPHDVVSGDRISGLSVTSDYKVIGGWERQTVSVSFDLALFMHAGEDVLLECRFLDHRGELVELSSLGIPYVTSDLGGPIESVSSYRYRRILHPRGAWAHYRNLCIDIPLEFLLLTPGAHSLTCEVVIVSSDDRVLCGDMGRVNLHVAGSLKDADANDVAPSSDIELESLEVDSSWYFSEAECVRVQATFCPKDASRQIAELAAGRAGELFAPYRVEISLEREDGRVLLQAFSDPLGMGFKPVTRGVCVDARLGVGEHSVVANFPKCEILGWSLGLDGQRGAAKHRLFARVRAISLKGDLLVEDSKEFFIKPASDSGRRIVEVRSPTPCIVDVVAHTFLQTPRLSCRALINIPGGRAIEEGLTVLCSLVGNGGEKREVFKRTLHAPRTAMWVRQQTGTIQRAIEFECSLGEFESKDLMAEVQLVSGSGTVVHRVIQGVNVAGVLVDAGSSSDQALGDLSVDSSDSNDELRSAVSSNDTQQSPIVRFVRGVVQALVRKR